MEDVDEARVHRPEVGQIRTNKLLVQVNVLFAPANDRLVKASHPLQVAVVSGEDAEAEVAPVACVQVEVVVVSANRLLLVYAPVHVI